MADTFEKFTRKVCGHLDLDCALRVADWLSREALTIWTLCFEQLNQIWHKVWEKELIGSV